MPAEWVWPWSGPVAPLAWPRHQHCRVKGPTVALMAGQTARALQGSFNTVPVLHSNQPEAVNGPGILIDTSPGIAYSETGLAMANPTFRFEGPFGLHFHHLYRPSNPGPDRLGRRPELNLAAVVINPSGVPVRLRLFRGAMRNSFAAPYRGHQLLGVKPLGPRPTAVQMLRGRLDPDLPEELTVPPRSRLVLLRTDLPALGVVNGMLRGESDGPFHLAMVAAPSPATDEEIFSHLDSRRLAPGRTYLTQLEAIERGLVFSRVSGVALGDTYQASLSHDLERQGSLHVPLTSTVRQSFATGEIQVNRLVAHMLDSALENVGTYGVRFDVDFLIRGSSAYAVVLSRGPACRSALRRKPHTHDPGTPGEQAAAVAAEPGATRRLHPRASSQYRAHPPAPAPARGSSPAPADPCRHTPPRDAHCNGYYASAHRKGCTAPVHCEGRIDSTRCSGRHQPRAGAPPRNGLCIRTAGSDCGTATPAFLIAPAVDPAHHLE